MTHSHCEMCLSRHCKVKVDNIDSCPLVLCDLGCGAKFHQCLQDEHLLLCPDERVACINTEYGCPLVMQRKKLGSHLEVCPASVMCCPTEWNRWPMYSVEEKKKLPLPSTIHKVRCGQLDVALAMRDQRMLVESLNAPKKTRKILRNRLTTRYPAAPFAHRSSSVESDMLTSEETSRNVSDDECGSTPWNLGNYPPGLQRSVCSRLNHATKLTPDSLTNDMTAKSVEKSKALKLKESHDVEMSNDLICSDVVTADDNKINTSAQRIDEKFEDTDTDKNKLSNDTKLCDILGVDINIDCITKYQPKPAEMFTFLCAQEFRRDEYAWHFKNVHNDIQSCLNGWMEQRCPLAYLGCTFSFRRFVPGHEGSNIVHSALTESFGLVATNNVKMRTNNSPDLIQTKSDDVTEHNVNNIMEFSGNGTADKSAYDYNHEPSIVSPDQVVNQSQDKTPPSAADCDTEQEIFTSYRAFSPIHVQSRQLQVDVHSWDASGLELQSLPFEVLQHIARHLDSFSLCNLGLTSKLLRDVCCSLLDERGIVIQMWEKRRWPDGRVMWKSYCNRWRFSTAFSPVRKWNFSGNNPISTHLQTCALNQDKLVRDSPVFVYPPGDAQLAETLQQLHVDRLARMESGNLRSLHWFYPGLDPRCNCPRMYLYD